jgi:CRISPR-associated endonuclease/helicase Cas3
MGGYYNMARTSDNAEKRRSEQVFLAVQTHAGRKQAELATIIGIPQRTLNLHLNKLRAAGRIRKEHTRWYVCAAFGERGLRSVPLTAEQAMCLSIAARAFAKVQDERNETAETALLMLSKALIDDANVSAYISDAAQEIARRPERTGYGKVFRDLMHAYVYRRKVYIRYTAASGAKFETIFEPYLFEPSLFGMTIYAIGFSEHVQAIRSYKLERIDRSALLPDAFEARTGIPTLADLRSAWSISYGDDLERVELEFAPTVKTRVRETQWHASQRTADGVGGALRWTADVADARDMLPWIRGWGSDVQVLKPDWVRGNVIQHVQQMNRIYGLATPAAALPAHFLPWAKVHAASGSVHRLVYHMIDVGMCAATLWRESLAAPTKQRIADRLKLDVERAGRLTAFWAALHDLGKASPAFQDHPSLRRRTPLLWKNIGDELRDAGLAFPERDPGETHARHETITMYALHPRYENVCGDSETADELTKLVAQMLSGHHGAFHSNGDIQSPHLTRRDTGAQIPAWSQVRRALTAEMRMIFDPPEVADFEPHTARDNAVMLQIAGLVTLADWLGSDADAFPAVAGQMALRDYAAHAERLARLAVRTADWRAAPPMPALDFARTFGFARRPAQEAAAAALHAAPLPALAIVELPMGAGKTEIALDALADWLRRSGGAGAYFALPTTATSDQMHERVRRFLHAQIGPRATPLLVHGRALLTQNPLPESADPIEEQQREGERTEALTWFLPRKKSLLANFGVGTIDQALLSVLQTNHYFVRLLGLSDKVVIFDEVHAYDAYMSMLLERLLHWLGRLGASVILLSATLPAHTRRRLSRAYTRRKDDAPSGYPLLTIAPLHGETQTIALPAPAPTELRIGWLSDDVNAIIDELRARIAEGGCAAVICTTVARAQQVYRALCAAHIEGLTPENRILLHARFPQAWRSEIEAGVLAKFGPNTSDKAQPNPNRPAKAVVVATQVIEQSMDLDFDVMISDLAPADLLLQRAGRLQRHAVNDAARRHPRQLWIAAPHDEDELPTFDSAMTAVYDTHILLRSWLALRARGDAPITIPDDVAPLIEQVYGETQFEASSEEARRRMAAMRSEFEKDRSQREFAAMQRMVDKPESDIFGFGNTTLEEDDPNVHEAFQALTRFESPGTRVVFLHRSGDRLFVPAAGDAPEIQIEPNNAPTQAEVVRIAGMALTMNHHHVQRWLNTTSDPTLTALHARWSRIAELRHLRVAVLDDGSCSVPDADITLRLSREYGLEILKGE